MARTAGLVILSLFFAASAALSAPAWTEYRPQEVAFSVQMPGQWKVTTETANTAAGDIKVISADIDSDTVSYAAVYAVYPADKMRGRAVATTLDGARNGAVSNTKGTLRKEDKIEVGSLPARQIVIDTPSGIVVVMRFMMIGNALVQAVVSGPKGVENQPDTTRFLSSLKPVGS
jgi:hypothetical protein